jgi:hypothetical protein
MGGFKNETINGVFDAGTINIIIAHLTRCSKQMKADCVADGNFLENNEDAITNKLVGSYLNAEPDNFRYMSQSPEHYDCATSHYIGRTDITVISGDLFRDAKAYYIVECKRIDGTDTLNKKYIADGVARFISPVQSPKYSSYYMQNIMFGYVVKSIAIPYNADKIDKLQQSLLKEVTATKFVLKLNGDSQYYVYTCDYSSEDKKQIELSHLFFDFADVIYRK